MERFKNKVVLITGADGGIGSTLARRYCSEGAELILCFLEETENTKNLLSELRTKSKKNIYDCYFDLSNVEAIKDGIKSIKSLKIKIDVLINNAGIPHLALLPFTKIEDLKKVFQINYFAQVQLTQGLLSIIKKNEGAAVVNISSAAGLDPEPGNITYGATKACMALFTGILAKELAGIGIRVNAVAPGLTQTPFADAMGEKAKESMKDSSSMKRLALPDEIANAIIFLSSEEASFVNGQVLRVDGQM